MKTTVGLSVINWAFSLGGEHFSGKLSGYVNGEYHTHQLEHPLTTKEALALNKKDEISHRFSRYKKGMLSDRFNTRAELERVAIKEYKRVYPDAVALFGSFGVAGAMRCLDGPKAFKKRMNELYAERKKIGGYERSPERAAEIDHEAWEMIKALTPRVKKSKK